MFDTTRMGLFVYKGLCRHYLLSSSIVSDFLDRKLVLSVWRKCLVEGRKECFL